MDSCVWVIAKARIAKAFINPMELEQLNMDARN